MGKTVAHLIHANAKRPHGPGSRGTAIVARTNSADVWNGSPDCAARVRVTDAISGASGRAGTRNRRNAEERLTADFATELHESQRRKRFVCGMSKMARTLAQHAGSGVDRRAGCGPMPVIRTRIFFAEPAMPATQRDSRYGGIPADRNSVTMRMAR
ncbi:hypothetical protein ACV229_24760 [Burkholderia sp. MR1-5-21]